MNKKIKKIMEEYREFVTEYDEHVNLTIHEYAWLRLIADLEREDANDKQMVTSLKNIARKLRDIDMSYRIRREKCDKTRE